MRNSQMEGKAKQEDGRNGGPPKKRKKKHDPEPSLDPALTKLSKQSTQQPGIHASISVSVLGNDC